MYGYVYPVRPNELYHHGILGMHWGIRRFQNKDGSLTSVGRKHYSLGEKIANNRRKSLNKASNRNQKIADKLTKHGFDEAAKPYQEKADEYEKQSLTIDSKKYDTAIKIGAAVAVSALAIYGGKKLYEVGMAEKADWDNVRSTVDRYNTLKMEAIKDPNARSIYSFGNKTNIEALNRYNESHMEPAKKYYSMTKEGIRATQRHLKILKKRR